MSVDLVFDIPQMADYLTAPPHTCRRLLSGGDIRAAKVGRGWRVLKSEIDAYLRGEVPDHAERGNGAGDGDTAEVEA